LIDKGDPTGVDPASVVLERYVAPAPIVEATVDVEWRPCVELRNLRVVPVRSGANVHGARGIGILSAGEAQGGEQQCSERMDEQAAAHE
jgi:hypothetical protein